MKDWKPHLSQLRWDFRDAGCFLGFMLFMLIDRLHCVLEIREIRETPRDN